MLNMGLANSEVFSRSFEAQKWIPLFLIIKNGVQNIHYFSNRVCWHRWISMTELN